MGDRGSGVLPPRGAGETRCERSAEHVTQEEEVDLMRVLVLDDAPGEDAHVEEAGFEPELALRRLGGDARGDVDGDLRGHEVPVEGACVESFANLSLLDLRAALEDVVAAGRLRGAGK